MADDLVKHLREQARMWKVPEEQIEHKAANRIEELEQEIAESDKRIEFLEDEIQSLKYEMRELGERS